GAAPAAPAGNGAPAAPAGDAGTPPPAAAPTEPPKGPGWVFELRGYHYHNPRNNPSNIGPAFVARTLLKNLRQEEMPLPLEERLPGGPTAFPLKKLGIGHSILITTQSVSWQNKLEVDDYDDETKADDKNGGKDKPKPAVARPAAPMM